MIHVGIDLHRDSCRVKALDDLTGEVLLEEVLPSERDAMLDCLRPLQERGSLRIAMETCGFAGYWADVLDPLGDVAVLHAREVASRRVGKRKYDRRDTDLLTRLSVTNDLPRAHIGTTAARDWKDLLRYRVGLVRVGTRLRVRLRNVAQRYGARLPASEVDSPKGRGLWAEWELREVHRLIVDQLLEVLEEIEARTVAVDAKIAEWAPRYARPRHTELLDSLPGVGLFGALLIDSEVGDWSRFERPESVGCFAGLVPSEESSGNRVRRGKITREGSSYLRWMAVQAALKHACSPRLHALHVRVADRRGAMKARVAVARELLEIAWHLITNDTPYEERLPRGSGVVTPPVAPAAEGATRSSPRLKEPEGKGDLPARRSGQLVGPQTH